MNYQIHNLNIFLKWNLQIAGILGKLQTSVFMYQNHLPYPQLQILTIFVKHDVSSQ